MDREAVGELRHLLRRQRRGDLPAARTGCRSGRGRLPSDAFPRPGRAARAAVRPTRTRAATPRRVRVDDGRRGRTGCPLRHLPCPARCPAGARTRPSEVSKELFGRIVFNIAIGNSDDHARNHAAFWDGQHLDLTPAYDLAPGNRSGETSSQAMSIDRHGNRASTFGTCLAAAHVYGLSTRQGREIIDRVVTAIHDGWAEAADRARLSQLDRELLWGLQILNPAASYDLSGS